MLNTDPTKYVLSKEILSSFARRTDSIFNLSGNAEAYPKPELFVQFPRHVPKLECTVYCTRDLTHVTAGSRTRSPGTIFRQGDMTTSDNWILEEITRDHF